MLVVGSLNRDYVLRVGRRPDAGETVGGAELELFCGGKGANQAVAAAVLGAPVAMMGCVGDDDAGTALRGCVRRAGVDVAGVEAIPNVASGSAFITVTGDGENAIVVAAGANAALDAAWIRAHTAAFSPASVLLVQLEIPIDGACEAICLATAGTTVICNPSPPKPLPLHVLHRIDILVVNASEAAWYAAAAIPPEVALTPTNEPSGRRGLVELPDALGVARRLHRQGPSVVILTLGSQGAIVVSEEGAWHLDAPRVTVVDTTGAGDAFVGALAAGVWAKRPLLDSVADAVIAGSITATRPGAQSSLPKQQEVRTRSSPHVHRLG